MKRLALLVMIASVVALGCQRTTERRTGEHTGRPGAKERAPEQHTGTKERAPEQHTGAKEKSSTAPKSMPPSSTAPSTSEGKAKTDTGTGPGLNDQQGQTGQSSEPASKPAGSSSTNP